MAGPTVNAVLDGSVQGVVVQAKKSTFNPLSCNPHLANSCAFESSVALNWATTVVSLTSR